MHAAGLGVSEWVEQLIMTFSISPSGLFWKQIPLHMHGMLLDKIA